MKLLKCIAVLACAFGSGSALAGSTIDNTKITLIGTGPFYDVWCGYKCLLVAFETIPGGSPCWMNAGWAYTLNISTADGRAIAAVILAAKASQSTVQAGGTGTCTFSNRVEELSYFIVK